MNGYSFSVLPTNKIVNKEIRTAHGNLKQVYNIEVKSGLGGQLSINGEVKLEADLETPVITMSGLGGHLWRLFGQGHPVTYCSFEVR